ncbi:E3 ubiquitin-protein ligase RNF4-like [Stegodyphus dumicola]|uniref:E3 ubiquitin-protein ligase RNF4-like n=1 Tax=Stegodyphus dumicola TaxID=202533 RepID=UPI0015A7624C|nr:E3 ubiquitin-protein ligase RNF4-like [Stegodyphus dumicola]XP_035211675.1 E3 ubiquitin-protein ligase RNF4-like [Stegodyphus dumicola]
MDERQPDESSPTILSAFISYGPVTQVEMFPIRARFETVTQEDRRTEERVVGFQMLVPYSPGKFTKPKMTASQDTIHTNRRKRKKNGSKIRRKTQPLAIKQNDRKTKKSKKNNVTRVCCRICWDTATELKKQGISMHVTICGHVLCALCLLKVGRTCPCCRTEITYPVRPLYLE